LALVAAFATVYLAWGVASQSRFAYQNSLSWSEGNIAFAASTTAFVASTVLSGVIITYRVFRENYSLLLLLPVLHVFLVGLPVAGIVFGVVVISTWSITRVQSAT